MATKLIGTVMELSAPYTDGLQPHWLQKFGVKLVIGANKIRYSTIFSSWDSGRKYHAKVAMAKAPSRRIARTEKILPKSWRSISMSKVIPSIIIVKMMVGAPIMPATSYTGSGKRMPSRDKVSIIR